MTNRTNAPAAQSMPSQQTLQQRRAAAAWTDTQSVSRDTRKAYQTLVRKFPATVQRDGLGAALVSLQAKGDQEDRLLSQHLSCWVLGKLGGESRATDLLNWLLGQNSAAYRRAASESLAYLMWLKRFAEAWGELK